MKAMPAGKCPICNSSSELTDFSSKEHVFGDYRVKCPRCGTYIISDIGKENIVIAFEMGDAAVREYAAEASSSEYIPTKALYIEVAKRARQGGGIDIDVPRSIISHVLRKRLDARSTVGIETLVSILKNN
jgi:endogenous inhibitor of DNA gyrase (YacG/DUF329 family)